MRFCVIVLSTCCSCNTHTYMYIYIYIYETYALWFDTVIDIECSANLLRSLMSQKKKIAVERN